MLLKKSLGFYVSWNFIVRYFKLTTSSDALPLETRCPFCSGHHLSIYQDTTTKADWHYCSDCKVSGDMIEFFARMTNSSIRDALQLLKESGVEQFRKLDEEMIEKYLKRRKDFKEDIPEFWKRAQEFLASHRSKYCMALQDRFLIHGQMSRDRWMNGPGQLIGGCSREDLDRLFVDNGVKIIPNQPAQKAFAYWTDALVFPFWIAPNHIRGIHAIGRKGDPQDRHTFALNRKGNYSSPDGALDIGLWGLEAALDSDSEYVVAIEHLLFAARLQVRHCNTASRLLPIVSWIDDGRWLTRNTWKMLNHKRLVFWGFELTTSLLAAAIETNASIYIPQLESLDNQNVGHYLRRHGSSGILNIANRNAVPWQDIIKQMSSDNPAEFLRTCRELETYGSLLGERINDVTGRIYIDTGRPKHRTIQLHRRFVTESDYGWSCFGGDPRTAFDSSKDVRVVGNEKRKEFQLTDFILRIEKIVTTKDDSRYVGRILFNGRSIDFDESSSAFEKSPLEMIRKLCLRAGAGRPKNQNYIKIDLIAVAIAFHQPVLVKLT